MAGYIFNSNQIPTVSVPRIIVDKYLKEATGVQIKVILSLFRFENMAVTPEDIAKHCNISVDDVKVALDFWIKNEILIRRGASLILAGATSVQAQTLPRYNPESILERKTDDAEFSMLLDEVQRLVGKTLNHNDASVVFALYDHLGFSVNLVLMIINYCISNGKSNFRYIEKVALDWHDRGIDSFDKAEALIKALEKREKFETAVVIYFGIEDRARSKKEKEYIQSWNETFGMSLDMVKQAFEICIDKKAKLNFSYINGILADWFKKGYKKVSDIPASSPRPNSTGDEKSFDTSDIENKLLQRLAGE